MVIQELDQGSNEWLQLRKSKVTATDAPIIMGASHWKTKLQLYHEKTDHEYTTPINERMQRGLDLEPHARDLFTLKTGIHVEPKVVVKDWAMASLDGLNELGNVAVEIKCPGNLDHQSALKGYVPEHYFPQLQHQMYVCGLKKMYYFSFDGFDGIALEVYRDDEYIEKMVEEEKKFYDCLVNKTPPEPSEEDYVYREDQEWEECALMWKSLSSSIKRLQEKEEKIREKLVNLSGGYNSKGAGVSLCQIQRKGNIDYSRIPELKNIDLDAYRKNDSVYWKIQCK